MKKLFCVLMALAMLLSLSACNSNPKQEEETVVEEGFVPALDTASECSINVAGGYDNF